MTSMTNFERNVVYLYRDFWDEYGDPRVGKLPLMGGGPWRVIGLVACYLYLVKVYGPKAMKHRNPLDIRWTIRVYNSCMIAWNAWGFWQASAMSRWGTIAWGCRPIDTENTSPQELEKIWLGWIFFISRLVEFVDTFCFVLRKKYRQVSAFHVFHHSTVPILSWFFIKFAPGDNASLFPYINAAVHTLMYTHYLMSTFGWNVWYKKYLTQLQISQFIIMIAHTFHLVFLPPHCFPRTFLAAQFIFAIIFLCLFLSFYRDSYTAAQTAAAKRKSAAVTPGGGNREVSVIDDETVRSKTMHQDYSKLATDHQVDDKNHNHLGGKRKVL